jgi:hypothetical protein
MDPSPCSKEDILLHASYGQGSVKVQLLATSMFKIGSSGSAFLSCGGPGDFICGKMIGAGS